MSIRFFMALGITLVFLFASCEKENALPSIDIMVAWPDSVFPGDTVHFEGTASDRDAIELSLDVYYNTQLLDTNFWVAPKVIGDHYLVFVADDGVITVEDSVLVFVRDTMGIFVDSRDNHEYRWVKIGQQIWMAENLAFLPEVYPGEVGAQDTALYYVYGYEGYDVEVAKQSENFAKYGVLYNWKAASQGALNSSTVPSGVQGVCPEGWHLPSLDEWRILLNPQIQIHPDLLSTSGWIFDNIGTNATGFNVLPAGFRATWGGDFIFCSEGLVSLFWTTTDHPLYWIPDDLVSVIRFIPVGLIGGHPLYSPWGEGLSVRCIKDK